MSFTYGFYDSINHDRTYNARQMSEIFDGIINDGVFESIGSKFMVSAVSGMQIKVGSGRAWFNHTWTNNDSDMPLTLDAAEPLYKRIDAIVLEVNENQDTRENSIKIIKGTPATYPVKPNLIDAEGIHQHPLAWITIKGGATSIAQADIENAVGTRAVPYVTAILEVTDVEQLLAQWDDDFHTWFQGIKSELDGDIVTNLINMIDRVDDKVDIVDGKVDQSSPKIGDICETVNSTIQDGKDWVLCNGERFSRDEAPALYDHLLGVPENGWTYYSPNVKSKHFFSTASIHYENGYYIMETFYGCYATKDPSLTNGWFKIYTPDRHFYRVFFVNGSWIFVRLTGYSSGASLQWYVSSSQELERVTLKSYTHTTTEIKGSGSSNIFYVDGYWYLFYSNSIYRSPNLSDEFTRVFYDARLNFTSNHGDCRLSIEKIQNGKLNFTCPCNNSSYTPPYGVLSVSSPTGEENTWSVSTVCGSSSNLFLRVYTRPKYIRGLHLVPVSVQSIIPISDISDMFGLYVSSDGATYTNVLPRMNILGVSELNNSFIAFGYNTDRDVFGYWIGPSIENLIFHEYWKIPLPIRRRLPGDYNYNNVDLSGYLIENFNGTLYFGGDSGVFLSGSDVSNLNWIQPVEDPMDYDATLSSSDKNIDTYIYAMDNGYFIRSVRGRYQTDSQGYMFYLRKPGSNVSIPIGSDHSYLSPFSIYVGNNFYSPHRHFGLGPDGLFFVEDNGSNCYIWRSYNGETPLFPKRNYYLPKPSGSSKDMSFCGYANGVYFVFWTGNSQYLCYSTAPSFDLNFGSAVNVPWIGSYVANNNTYRNPVIFKEKIVFTTTTNALIFFDPSTGVYETRELPAKAIVCFIDENKLYVRLEDDRILVTDSTDFIFEASDVFGFYSIRHFQNAYYALEGDSDGGSQSIAFSENLNGPWTRLPFHVDNWYSTILGLDGNTIAADEYQKLPTLPTNDNTTINKFICAGVPENGG